MVSGILAVIGRIPKLYPKRALSQTPVVAGHGPCPTSIEPPRRTVPQHGGLNRFFNIFNSFSKIRAVEATLGDPVAVSIEPTSDCHTFELHGHLVFESGGPVGEYRPVFSDTQAKPS